jgi:hypothetical protein
MEVEQIYQRLWVKSFPIGFDEGRAEFDNFWNSPYSELPEHRKATAVIFSNLLTEMGNFASSSYYEGELAYNDECDARVREAKNANRNRLSEDNLSLAQIFG